MEVTVRWFAAYRELTGVESETCITDAATPSELFNEQAEKYISLQGRKAALLAINDEMADWETPLSEGDVILFFPPVAGG